MRYQETLSKVNALVLSNNGTDFKVLCRKSLSLYKLAVLHGDHKED